MPSSVSRFLSKDKNKQVQVGEGNQKALFSIAITSNFRGEHYSFSWITPLYPWSVPYNAEY